LCRPSIADQFPAQIAWGGHPRARKILLLRFDKFAARIHGGKLISAYAPE